MELSSEQQGHLGLVPAKEFQKANSHIWDSYPKLQWLLRKRHDNGLAASGAV